MRPANGSAIVFQTYAAAGPASRPPRRGLPGRRIRRLERAFGRGRRIGENRVEERLHADVAGGGRAEDGEDLPAATPRFNPATSSSCVSVPASKNFSISASSASATISISASRADWAALSQVRRYRGLRSAFRSRRSRTCRPSSRRDRRRHGRLLLADRQLNGDDGCGRRRRAATRSLGRGWRARGRGGCRTMIRGSSSSSAAAQIFSVDTCTPCTASTTTIAASTTRSAASRVAEEIAHAGRVDEVDFLFVPLEVGEAGGRACACGRSLLRRSR